MNKKSYKIKHIDGITDIIAKGGIINNELVVEYRFEGMTYGQTIPLKKSYNCVNCSKAMAVDINPYTFNETGENTARKTFYGGWVCSEDCEKEFDLRMRKDAQRSGR